MYLRPVFYTHKYELNKFNQALRGRKKTRGNYNNSRNWRFQSGSRFRIPNDIFYYWTVFIPEVNPYKYNKEDCDLYAKGYTGYEDICQRT